ncbi:hypothetical protein [Marinobacterium aestuariivivens]|uniref:Chemotaxis protein n=1 Tax=Marinobacterium aestuariivivens TaxID=1698799 RepID=A0ABW2AA53_9GAMM
MGIESEQALNLFYQTVSMKAVGNLTDFVRSHMLELSTIGERIEQAIRSFNDLDRAHQAVLKAQRQISHLEPLTDEWRACLKLQQEIDLYNGALTHLEAFFNRLKSELLEQRIERHTEQLDSLNRLLETMTDEIDEGQRQANRLRMDIVEAGAAVSSSLKRISNVWRRRRHA